MSQDDAQQSLLSRHGDEAHSLLQNHKTSLEDIDSDSDPLDSDFHDVTTTITAPESDGTPGLFITLLTAAAGISGLLFGYDTGIISATLVSVNFDLSNRALTSLDKSLITSATALFALIISPFSSTLADSLGRRRIILVADTLFIIGAIVQAFCHTVPVMVFGRCIVGAAVGAASFVVPLYIAEIAPAVHRGRLVTSNVLFITLGQVFAYIVGWALTEYGNPATAWRWMVGLGALPAILQMGLLAIMPETPRWLVRKGDVSAARRVVIKANGCGPSDADVVIRDIEIEVGNEQEETAALRVRRENSKSSAVSSWVSDTWYDLFTVPRNRRALAIACLLQGLQQLSGFNSLMYFSATIFTMVGFTQPTLTSLTIAVTNMAFTCLALVTIDRIGRRRILLWSIPLMIMGLLLSAYGFSKLHTFGSPTNPTALILVSFMIYVAGYAIGIGNVPWMQSELFPLSVRSVGSGVATGTNWGANFVVGLTFLPMMDRLSAPWTFVLYAGVCTVGWILVWCVYPETAGLSLEEATGLLDEGWGVRR